MSEKELETGDISKILDLLPHRYPMLLVDRILDYKKDERLVALKNVTANEPYFQGHFPGHPIMPGVLILEALAQATGLYAFQSLRERGDMSEYLYLFTGIDNAKFRRQVIPGDQLILTIEPRQYRRGMLKVDASATVEGKIAASASILCAEKKV